MMMMMMLRTSKQILGSAFSNIPPANQVWANVMFLHLSVRPPPPPHTNPCTVKGGQYASYWNAFLLKANIFSLPYARDMFFPFHIGIEIRRG